MTAASNEKRDASLESARDDSLPQTRGYTVLREVEAEFERVKSAAILL